MEKLKVRVAIVQNLGALRDLSIVGNDLGWERRTEARQPARPCADVLAADELVRLGTNTIGGNNDVGLDGPSVLKPHPCLFLALVVLRGATAVLDLDTDALELRDQHLEELGPVVEVKPSGRIELGCGVAVVQPKGVGAGYALSRAPVEGDAWVRRDAIIFLRHVGPGLYVVDELGCNHEEVA